MKLAGSRAAAFCRRPDLGLSGALLHGPDGGLLALRRRDLEAAVTDGDRLRLTRLEPDALRRDPAALDAALKARGFFAGRQAVSVEGAKDALAGLLEPLLPGLTADDAFLIVTATGLGPRSTLRRLFEGTPALAALGLYPDPPGAADIAGRIAATGGPSEISPGARDRLAALGADLDPGSFERLLETIALYAMGADRLEASHVEALAPLGPGADLDRLVGAVAAGRSAEIGPLVARLAASGTAPATALGAAARHFRRLFAMAAGAGSQGPPRGPRADAIRAELAIWPLPRLEAAARELIAAERRLRSAGPKPDAAMAERALIRVAMMAGRPR